jgi:hypothetical protein
MSMEQGQIVDWQGKIEELREDPAAVSLDPQ